MKGEAGRGQERGIPSAGAVLPDGVVVELVFNRERAETAFVRYESGAWTKEAAVETPAGRLVPIGARNNLLVHDVVLLPSQPEEYGSEPELLAAMREFIHRYVDLSPEFEEVAALYALFTWLYDTFEEVPYLRVRGDYGSGKSRFLLTVGSLCYRPIFASGTATVSPIFRILDTFRGTLIVDEADFRLSDEKAEIVKILNNGNARGFPVLRAESVNRREFDPRAYSVFGPKLIATRGTFEDQALESRCFTEEMGGRPLRAEIPLNLPAALRSDAIRLRNQLLLFRFRNLARPRDLALAADRSLEPRLAQILSPLMATIADEEARGRLRALARGLERRLVADRGMETEAQLLEVVRDLAAAEVPLSVKEIAALFADRHEKDYDRTVSPKWIGYLLRRKLGLHPEKRHGGIFVLPESDRSKLLRLYERYGVERKEMKDVEDMSA